MVSTLEQKQVPNGTGPGVRRSKRPLLASRTRFNVLWKPPKLGNKVKLGKKVQFGNKLLNIIFYVKHTKNVIDNYVNADILSESRWGRNCLYRHN